MKMTPHRWGLFYAAIALVWLTGLTVFTTKGFDPLGWEGFERFSWGLFATWLVGTAYGLGRIIHD